MPTSPRRQARLNPERLVAPMVLNGAINGSTLASWVAQCLAPTLSPGDIVIADRLGSRKIAGAGHVVEARGASLMFQPTRPI